MQKWILFGVAAALATAVACGGDKTGSPASPSSTPRTPSEGAYPDGATLKVTAPTPVSPGNGSTVDVFNPVLTVTASNPKFVPSLALAYRFQLLSGSTVVKETRGTALTWIPDGLSNRTTYGWRARAESGTYFGPWSDTWTFTTPDKPEGYNRPGELYDPLTDGKTVGQVVGSVTFIPGLGAKLNNLGSYIQYRLPETVTGGEFSYLVTNLVFNTEGGKTKMMAMSEGLSDITTNDRRCTVEKRGNPAGQVAWRFITHDDQIDTQGAERIVVQFSPSNTYFWKATWGGNRFNVLIKNGGVNGNTIYNFGKSYSGVYDPNPHYAFVGGPGGRGGLASGSVPDIIVRQVWLSRNPRPAFANQ